MSAVARSTVFTCGPALERLARAVRERGLPAGTVVLRQGDPADDLFVLVRGDLVVDHHDGSGPRPRIHEMRAPDYLGEIGLVERGPRTATVTTASDAVVWRLSGDLFLETVTAMPAFSRRSPAVSAPAWRGPRRCEVDRVVDPTGTSSRS